MSVVPIDRRLSLRKHARVPIDRQLYFPIAVRTPTVGDGRRTVGTTDMFLQWYFPIAVRTPTVGDDRRIVGATDMFLQ